ncbi:hypothetical protein DPEC_G00064150 [Dallia pectoralis]|uniref:Uncharacterized protein n=1 Tax=Dallia pectoralis TaxID=75939 RepID=A0ACC2H8C3_DALPE|nr:hypothetical protein DPEC_G00064150 [Dallia pectoralis]
MYWELKRRAPPDIPVYQQAPLQDDVWEVLDGDRDDFLVYDRCGRLTFHIVLPYSYLQKPYIEAAVRATYYNNICGNCTVDLNSTSWNDTQHISSSLSETEDTTTSIPTHTRTYRWLLVYSSVPITCIFLSHHLLIWPHPGCQSVDHSTSTLPLLPSSPASSTPIAMRYLTTNPLLLVPDRYACATSLCLPATSARFINVTVHPAYNLSSDCPFLDSMIGLVFRCSLIYIILFADVYYQSLLTKRSEHTRGR